MFFVYFLRKKKKKTAFTFFTFKLMVHTFFLTLGWSSKCQQGRPHRGSNTDVQTVENEDIKSWIPTYVGREMKQLVWFFRFSVLLGLISRLRLGVMRQKRRWQMKAFKRMKRAKPCQQWICRACFFTTDSLHILERW